jgi:hypothetical protein
LQQLLSARRTKLDETHRLYAIFRDMDLLEEQLEEIVKYMAADDTGKHLQGACGIYWRLRSLCSCGLFFSLFFCSGGGSC